ncbi:hypothetical protein FBUS_01101 [Fasciolopsis buskii]|uniref:Uncharacterized protein n=1 Tax=Fasciolopsis buskii TaxID=27845 RepID=A0A8E0S782_9TREM|nr:hypothetical protein FBUS_01101 [Fasciolopsis buski]
MVALSSSSAQSCAPALCELSRSPSISLSNDCTTLLRTEFTMVVKLHWSIPSCDSSSASGGPILRSPIPLIPGSYQLKASSPSSSTGTAALIQTKLSRNRKKLKIGRNNYISSDISTRSLSANPLCAFIGYRFRTFYHSTRGLRIVYNRFTVVTEVSSLLFCETSTQDIHNANLSLLFTVQDVI